MRRLLVVILCFVAVSCLVPRDASAGDWAIWLNFCGSGYWGGGFYYGGWGGYYGGYHGGFDQVSLRLPPRSSRSLVGAPSCIGVLHHLVIVSLHLQHAFGLVERLVQGCDRGQVRISNALAIT